MQRPNQQIVYSEDDDGIASFLFCLDPQNAVRFFQQFGGTESYMSKDLRDNIARITNEDYANAVFEYFKGEKLSIPKAERYFRKIREKEALRLLKAGKTTNEVALTLDVTARSIQFYLSRADEETKREIATAKAKTRLERVKDRQEKRKKRNLEQNAAGWDHPDKTFCGTNNKIEHFV